jgi:hypothetical protein
VETGFVKSVVCKFCNKDFEATRSDAVRCPACREEYLKEYRRKDETKLRRRDQTRKLREQALNGYGHKCACCGEARFEFLAIDHVNGGGRKERETMSPSQIAKKAINEGFPSMYQLLCHNCNCAKGWYGVCPHQTEKQTA